MSEPYLSPWGRVGEAIAMFWPNQSPRNPPRPRTGPRRTPEAFVWSGIGEGEQAAAEVLLSGRIGIPNVQPQRVRGVMGANWTEDFESASMTVNITFYDPYGHARRIVSSGTWMHLSLPMDSFIWEIGTFYIWETRKTDKTRDTVTFTGFDMCSRLDRVGPEDRIYRRKHVWAIAREIGNRFGVEMVVERSGAYFEQLPFKQATPYEQIAEAYSQSEKVTGVKHRIRAQGEKIWIYRVDHGRLDKSQNKKAMIFLETGGTSVDSRRSNVISAEVIESLEGKKTIVYGRGVRRVNPADPNSLVFQFPAVVARSKDFQKYGPLIETLDLTQSSMAQRDIRAIVIRTLQAKGDLSRVGRYEIPGHPAVRAGHRIGVYDREGSGQYGAVYVSRVSHDLNGSTLRTRVETTPRLVPVKINVITSSPDVVGGQGHLPDNPAYGVPESSRPGGAGSPYYGPPAPAGSNTGQTFNEPQMIQIINAYIASGDWRAAISSGRSPLEGMGKYIVEQCRGKMDPRFLVAVGVHEGRLGTYPPARSAKNTWGILRNSGLVRFSTWQEAIRFFINNLTRPDGYYRDRDTVRLIQQRYAPMGASNDPNGLNMNWVGGVTAAMGEMGGPTNPDTIVKYLPRGANRSSAWRAKPLP